MNNKEGTSFDETLRGFKDDPNGLNSHVVNLLETQINGSLKEEIVSYRKVEALFPIISILFNDQTRVEIFVQIQRIGKHAAEQKYHDDEDSQESIHGVRVVMINP